MARAKILRTLAEVAAVASKKKDERSYLVGAIGFRSDGAVVVSYNGAAMDRSMKTHAEVRLAAKLDVGSVVYVARRARDGKLAMAKPCPNCERTLRLCGVKKIIYSEGPDSFEEISFS